MLIDASDQPCTWGKASREYFYGREGSLNAPLAGAVLLCVFKTAAYITGEKKWEDEYRLAALEKPYQYADIMTQYWVRYTVLIGECLSKEMDFASEALKKSDLFSEILLLSSLNYSDEEMAMLCFYLLFQMEQDEQLLAKYRCALERTNALPALSHCRASRNRLLGCASSVTIAFLSRGNCTVFPPFSCLFVEIDPGIIVAANSPHQED